VSSEEAELCLPRFLSASEAQARNVLASQRERDTYDAAIDFVCLAMDAWSGPAEQKILGDLSASLHLIWGALTDEMDAPGRGSPEQNAEAVRRMRRAAQEWLDACRDVGSRARYLDRWIYEECGYARTDSGPR
jgi:hypothetical protein